MMNQVLQAFRSWDERQQTIDQIGPGKGNQKAVSRLQLDHFRECRHRLSLSLSAHEKPFMPLLDNAIKRLEKELYPNILSRLFFRLKDVFIDRPAYLQSIEQQRNENIAQVKRQLEKSGLGSFPGDLVKQLQSGVPISLSCQLDNQRSLKVHLHFVKDANENYQFKRIDAEIGNSRHQFKLNEWPGLNMVQIRNLLEGRAIKQDYADLSGRQNTRWLELASDGHVKQYLKEYGYEPEKLLDGLPFANKHAILDQLEKGYLVKLNNGYLQAAPADSTILFFDQQQKQVSAEHFKAPAREQAVVKQMVQTPKSGIRKQVKRSIAH